MRVRSGMSGEAAKELSVTLAAKTDWWGFCHSCGARIVGTPAFIQAHSETCGDMPLNL